MATWLPWLHWLALVAGLIITLVLAAWCTPRHWWRRPTAGNAALLAGGTWAGSSLLLAVLAAVGSGVPPRHPTPVTSTSASVITSPTSLPSNFSCTSPPGPLVKFRVHRDLNFRTGPGTDTPWLAVLPAGSNLQTTGQRCGDWWQVRATLAGRDKTGWVSSLWLRRAVMPATLSGAP